MIPSELHSPQSASSSISFGCIEDEEEEEEEEEEEVNIPRIDNNDILLSTGRPPLRHSISETSSERSVHGTSHRSSHLTSERSDYGGSCQSLESIEVTDKRFNEQNVETSMSQKPDTLNLGVKSLSSSDQRAIDSAIDVITSASDRAITPEEHSSPTSCKSSAKRLFGRCKPVSPPGGGLGAAAEEPGKEAYAALVNAPRNRSIRTPVGIPDSPSLSSPTEDTNPLRRLRAQTSSGSSTHSNGNNYFAKDGPSRPPPRQSPPTTNSAPRQRRFPLVLDTSAPPSTTSAPSSTTTPTTPQQYSVRSVSLSAEQLGFGDEEDVFWTMKVNFGQVDVKTNDKGSSPNYKTEEVLLMRRTLSRDVTVQDCCTALTECKINLTAAIKLLKLRQIISTRLTNNVDSCKSALIQSEWNVDEAANRLANGDISDLVHL